MADPAMLLASDHTEIMKFLIQNYHLVLPKIVKSTPQEILGLCRSIAKSQQDTQRAMLFSAAAAAVRHSNKTLTKITQKEWQPAIPVVKLIYLAESTKELKKILASEFKSVKHPASLKTGLGVASQIFVDGEDSVYDVDFWVSALIHHPGQLFGGLSNLTHKLEQVKDKVLGVAAADAVGAIAGAVGAAVAGKDIKGIAAGAASGAVASSIKSAV